MFEAQADAVLLHLRVTPAADKDMIQGPVLRDDGREYLCVRVRARPDKGAANKAVSVVLARELGIAKSEVSLLRGSASRTKTVRIVVTGEAKAQLVLALERFRDERTID